MYSLITKLICCKTIVILRDFYLINLWNFLLGGLGWSSRTVMLVNAVYLDCSTEAWKCFQVLQEYSKPNQSFICASRQEDILESILKIIDDTYSENHNVRSRNGEQVLDILKVFESYHIFSFVPFVHLLIHCSFTRSFLRARVL